MDKSNEFFVNESGRLIRSIYDSHDRESFEIDVYGVHRIGFTWIWNPTKGPARSITDSWLKSEDGQDFQKFADDMTEDMYKPRPGVPPWEDDDEFELPDLSADDE